jgi:hypothetical protein
MGKGENMKRSFDLKQASDDGYLRFTTHYTMTLGTLAKWFFNGSKALHNNLMHNFFWKSSWLPILAIVIVMTILHTIIF